MDANGGIHPVGKSRLRERQSDHCGHYLFPRVSSRLLFTDLYVDMRFSHELLGIVEGYH
jgi:hypothetical protein